MRNILKVFLIACVLNGCAKAYVRSWSENEVTVCGNRKAFNKGTVAHTAMARCGGSARLIGGGTVDSGATATRSFGTYYIQNTREECATYKCIREPASE